MSTALKEFSPVLCVHCRKEFGLEDQEAKFLRLGGFNFHCPYCGGVLVFNSPQPLNASRRVGRA